MKNKSIRQHAKDKHVYLWELAVFLNCSESTVTRRLRMELSNEEKAKIMNVIDEIHKEKEREV